MELAILACLASSVLASFPCGIQYPTNEIQNAGRYERSNFDGNNSTTGKWPWQFLMAFDGRRKCGGTVISERWILTAAHCVNDIEHHSTVVVGVYSGIDHANLVPNDTKIHNTQVIEIWVHPNHSMMHLWDDIALVKLENPLAFDDTVSPICLPNSAQTIPNDAEAVATGFGDAIQYPGTNKAFTDGQLREVIVTITNLEECDERWFERAKEIQFKPKFNTLICAGWTGHGTGKGDSGGPLIMKSTDGSWFQLGITSFGDVNEFKEYYFEKKLPNVFADVRKYCDWIKNTTRGEASCQEKEVDMAIKINL